MWCQSVAPSCAVASHGRVLGIGVGAPVPGASGESGRSNPGAVAWSAALRLTRAARHGSLPCFLRRPQESTSSRGRSKRRRAPSARLAGSRSRKTIRPSPRSEVFTAYRHAPYHEVSTVSAPSPPRDEHTTKSKTLVLAKRLRHPCRSACIYDLVLIHIFSFQLTARHASQRSQSPTPLRHSSCV